MKNPIYGVVHLPYNVHIDVSNSLLGAKQYATRNGYTVVSKRVGYNAICIAKKVNNKWINHEI